MQRCASASTSTLTTSAACALGANLHAGAASAVPAGVCATVLQAAPSEPLAVAVARLVFCRMIAPGLIVTSARYVLRAAGLAAEPFLGSLPSCHLLPAPDHLSSLPRLLASVALRYGDVTIGNEGLIVHLSDDVLFRVVRLAFLAYNYKSAGYRQGVHPDGPVHDQWYAAASDPAPRVWLEKRGKDWPMKNRHGAQSPRCYIAWDQRLCNNEQGVVAAARQGEAALHAFLNRTPAHGGIARSGETLLGTRVPAILTAAGVLRSPVAVGETRGAPCGGPGSQLAQHAGRLAVVQHVQSAVLRADDAHQRHELRELAGRIAALSRPQLVDGLVQLLQAEPLLPQRLVRGVLPESLALWCPAVIAILPRHFTPGSAEVPFPPPLLPSGTPPPRVLFLLPFLLHLPWRSTYSSPLLPYPPTSLSTYACPPPPTFASRVPTPIYALLPAYLAACSFPVVRHAQLLWCEYGHRFDGAMRAGATHMPKYGPERLEALLPCSSMVLVPAVFGGAVGTDLVDVSRLLRGRPVPSGGPPNPRSFVYELDALPPLEAVEAVRPYARFGSSELPVAVVEGVEGVPAYRVVANASTSTASATAHGKRVRMDDDSAIGMQGAKKVAAVPMHATAVEHGPAANGSGARTPFAEEPRGCGGEAAPEAVHAVVTQLGPAVDGDVLHTGLGWPPVQHVRIHDYLRPPWAFRASAGDLSVTEPPLRLRGGGSTEADCTWTMAQPEDEGVTRAAREQREASVRALQESALWGHQDGPFDRKLYALVDASDDKGDAEAWAAILCAEEEEAAEAALCLLVEERLAIDAAIAEPLEDARQIVHSAGDVILTDDDLDNGGAPVPAVWPQRVLDVRLPTRANSLGSLAAAARELPCQSRVVLPGEGEAVVELSTAAAASAGCNGCKGCRTTAATVAPPAVAAFVPMHATAVQRGEAANGAGPRTPFAEDAPDGSALPLGVGSDDGLGRYVVALDFFIGAEHIGKWEGPLEPSAADGLCIYTEWFQWLVNDARIEHLRSDLQSRFYPMPSLPNLFDVEETENEFWRLRCSLTIKRRAGPGGRMLRSGAAGHMVKVLARMDLEEANDLYLEPPVYPDEGDGRGAADRSFSGPHRACLGFDESWLGGDLGPGQGYVCDVRLQVDLVDTHRSFVEFEFVKLPEEGRDEDGHWPLFTTAELSSRFELEMSHFEAALEAVFEMQYPRYEQAERTSVAADLHSAGEYGMVTHNLLKELFRSRHDICTVRRVGDAIFRLGGVHGVCGAICCYSNVVTACAAAQAVDPSSAALWRDAMYHVLCRTWASNEAEPAFRQLLRRNEQHVLSLASPPAGHAPYVVPNAQVDAAAAHATDMASPASFMAASFLDRTVQQLVEDGHGLESVVQGAVQEAEGTHQHVAAVAVVRYLSDAWCSLLVQRPGNVPAPLHWHDPGGKCEPGESPIQAARREMQEEVGLPVDTPMHYRAAWTEPFGSTVVLQLFIAHADPSWEPEMREGQPEYRWVPLDERFFMRPQLPSVAHVTHHLVRWQRSPEAVAALVPMHAAAVHHGPTAGDQRVTGTRGVPSGHTWPQTPRSNAS